MDSTPPPQRKSPWFLGHWRARRLKVLSRNQVLFFLENRFSRFILRNKASTEFSSKWQQNHSIALGQGGSKIRSSSQLPITSKCSAVVVTSCTGVVGWALLKATVPADGAEEDPFATRELDSWELGPMRRGCCSLLYRDCMTWSSDIKSPSLNRMRQFFNGFTIFLITTLSSSATRWRAGKLEGGVKVDRP